MVMPSLKALGNEGAAGMENKTLMGGSHLTIQTHGGAVKESFHLLVTRYFKSEWVLRKRRNLCPQLSVSRDATPAATLPNGPPPSLSSGGPYPGEFRSL